MDVLLDEIESLEAILMGDVQVKRNSETGYPELIETTIFPAVDYDSEKQYICVDLQVIPSVGYPEKSPIFNLLKPRGLDDSRLETIKSACVEKIKENRGFPVVFDLIEVIREHLSGSNLPSGQCVVCLYAFREGDQVAKTECYHYLHSYCLYRHLRAARKNYIEEQEKLPAWIRNASEPYEANCPVCREVIKDISDSLSSSLPPQELLNAPEFELTDELINLQKKMTNLFVQQKKRGGIIDTEAEVGSVISIAPTHNVPSDEEIPRPNDIQEPKNSLKDHGLHSEQTAKNRLHDLKIQKPGSQSKKQNHNQNEGNRPEATASSAFTPIVSQTHRCSSNPTNNNYQHANRRYFRGRRSHHSNHQQQQRFDNPNRQRPVVQSAADPSSEQSNLNQQKDLASYCQASTR